MWAATASWRSLNASPWYLVLIPRTKGNHYILFQETAVTQSVLYKASSEGVKTSWMAIAIVQWESMRPKPEYWQCWWGSFRGRTNRTVWLDTVCERGGGAEDDFRVCFWVLGRIVGLLNEMGSGDRRSRFDKRKGVRSWVLSCAWITGLPSRWRRPVEVTRVVWGSPSEKWSLKLWEWVKMACKVRAHSVSW